FAAELVPREDGEGQRVDARETGEGELEGERDAREDGCARERALGAERELRGERDKGLGVALVEAREDVAAEGALELALRERVGELEERRGGGRGREEFEIGEQPEL